MLRNNLLPPAALAVLFGALMANYWTEIIRSFGSKPSSDGFRHIFFINLDSSKERRASMEKQLSRRIVGNIVQYERFAGFHGRLLLDPMNQEGAELRSYVAEHGFRPVIGQKKQGFVAGVLRSHMVLWQRIADDYPIGVYMVLEDDVQLQLGWQRWIQAALQQLEGHEWDMLKLLNVAHHNITGYEGKIHLHPLIECSGGDKKHCSLKRDRIKEQIGDVCVRNECEKLVQLAPGTDGRNLGMQGILLNNRGDNNLRELIGTVQEHVKQRQITNIDEVLNEAAMHRHGIYFLTDSTGPKVVKVGTTHKVGAFDSKSGQQIGTRVKSSVKFGSTRQN